MDLSIFDEDIKIFYKKGFSIYYIINYIYRKCNTKVNSFLRNKPGVWYSFIKDSKITKEEVTKYVYNTLIYNKFYREV